MLHEYCLVRGSCFRCYRNIVWLERVASDVTGFYCMVRGSCFRCYRNIVWLEGVASDVTGILSG
jgi:hypothetical protein